MLVCVLTVVSMANADYSEMHYGGLQYHPPHGACARFTVAGRCSPCLQKDAPDATYSINACLADFTKPELIEGVACDTCSTRVRLCL